MGDILKILLVEDSQWECAEILNCIDKLDDISIVAVTNTSYGAIKHVQDYLPHAVILDLELHHGGGNGIQFLQELKMLNPKPYPYILVTTNNISSVTHASTRQLGADFVMVKAQDGYSAENVVSFLRTLKNTILSAYGRKSIFEETEEAPVRLKKRLHARTSSEMELVGISPKATGRKYLIDGILMVYDGKTQGICIELAQKYKKSDASIERAMQNAINQAWRKTSPTELNLNYTARVNPERGVPTLTELLHYYAEKLKKEY